MTILSGLGILLSLVFGCLLLALVGELYYLLWWKKQRIIRNSTRIEADYGNHNKELFYLFCWDKPSSIINQQTSNTIAANPESNHQHHHVLDPDIEMGKDLLLKALGEDGVESEIMRLAGPPRFLFTIKEETKEDLESDDGKSKGDRSMREPRTKSLGDLFMASSETQSPYFSPLASPPLKACSNLSAPNSNYDNPLFESTLEAEFNRLRSSPPPKFKFLRDAEEKLYIKLLEEAQKSRILQEFVLENSTPNASMEERESKDGGLTKSSKVLPLVSSSPLCNPLSLNPVESKPSLHH